MHNALGQRSKKTIGGAEVVYLYDLEGNLLAEHDATGTLIRDYVWMNGAPVAQIDQGEEFSYLHFDHLNSPLNSARLSLSRLLRSYSTPPTY